MKQTQLDFIKKALREDGRVSRNGCLQRYITRLGARINQLVNEGWEISGKYVKTEYGKDYVYFLIKEPDKTLF